jgi:hypothetical protein
VSDGRYCFEALQYTDSHLLNEIEANLRKACEEAHQKRFAQIGRILFLQDELQKLEDH